MTRHRTTPSDPKPDTRDRGAVMVELAFVLPILVTLLVGIVQFGGAYSARMSIQGAAREGARCLALKEVGCTVSGMVNGAKGSATLATTPFTNDKTCPNVDGYATVTVYATYTFSIPFVGGLGTKTFTSSASMRCGL